MHLYVHVPFCARRCSYCDFSIAVRRDVPSAEFVDQLLAEWHRRRLDEPWASAGPIETVYLGGGTPSRLKPVELARLLDGVTRTGLVASSAEVTIEANPDDVTASAVATWRAAGVNRVSLGAQSFSPAVLRWMHRTHEAAQVELAVEALRAGGVDNVSLDLIFGLPAALERNWSADLERALALDPAHLSLYGLTVEPHTPLGRWTARGEAVPGTDEAYAGEYLSAVEAFARAGWDHYEVSNAARPGHRSSHNQAYWQRRPYLGLGPSAHSALGRRRQWNLRDWSAWRRVIAAGDSTIDAEEELDDAQDLLERRYLGLRTSQGVDRSLVPADAQERWRREGWASVDQRRVQLTAEGWLRLDALVAAL